MDSDLYDEFGNYIGPELDSDDEEDDEEFRQPAAVVSSFTIGTNTGSDKVSQIYNVYLGKIPWNNVNFYSQEDEEMEAEEGDDDEEAKESDSTAVVLHEDKKYYPSASEVSR